MVLLYSSRFDLPSPSIRGVTWLAWLWKWIRGRVLSQGHSTPSSDKGGTRVVQGCRLGQSMVGDGQWYRFRRVPHKGNGPYHDPNPDPNTHPLIIFCRQLFRKQGQSATHRWLSVDGARWMSPTRPKHNMSPGSKHNMSPGSTRYQFRQVLLGMVRCFLFSKRQWICTAVFFKAEAVSVLSCTVGGG